MNTPEKIMKKDKINSFFIYITLRNLFYDHLKDKENNHKRIEDFKKYYRDDSTESLIDKFISSPTTEEDIDNSIMEEYYQDLFDKIYKEVSSWHWYDEKLFKLYFLTDRSLRDIAQDTKISLTSIYNSCSNYKKIIQEKFGEDIEDFFNQDYERI
tara:strand:+ start:2753 stop:3217 length:465 start_codon:yes stop_codon:yes gene_type:complete